MKSRHRVVAITYDRLCLLEFACAAEIFGLERDDAPASWYDFSVHHADGGGVSSAPALAISAAAHNADLAQADTIVVPGWRDVHERAPQKLLDELISAQARGTRIVSICTGAFVLAQAGVLDARRATTHWKHAALLADAYPTVVVEPEHLYVDDRGVVTSAGSAAGLDMLLYLVRTDYGSAVAHKVAQRLVLAPFRRGDQRQFMDSPLHYAREGRIARLQRWCREHLSEPLDLLRMADYAAMSPRTLQRQFREDTGLAPMEWLTLERLEHARILLESSSTSLVSVADLVGFGHPETLRKHFQTRFGMTPSTYRRSFSSSGSPRETNIGGRGG